MRRDRPSFVRQSTPSGRRRWSQRGSSGSYLQRPGLVWGWMARLIAAADNLLHQMGSRLVSPCSAALDHQAINTGQCPPHSDDQDTETVENLQPVTSLTSNPLHPSLLGDTGSHPNLPIFRVTCTSSPLLQGRPFFLWF
jgi:hypothetical protein